MFLINRVLYRLFSCNIASVMEKKEFSACKQCHGTIKDERGVRSYCLHCKKIENIEKRLIFEAEVADSTGSMIVKIFSQEIENFINTTSEDYAKMEKQERKGLLELSSFKNIILRVKSEQLVGGPTHLVLKSFKTDHRNGLEQIKEQSISQKTSFKPSWQ